VLILDKAIEERARTEELPDNFAPLRKLLGTADTFGNLTRRDLDNLDLTVPVDTDLQLAAEFLSDNDELLGLLAENMRTVERNRYNLEVYTSVAQLYRQNLAMITDIGRICYLLENAEKAAVEKKPKEALEAVDRSLELAKQIRQQRNTALRDAVATWYKSWFPRVPEANGRKFVHELDDVKDHVPDRTVDMSYLVYRELQLPFGQWVEAIRSARNQFAATNGLTLDQGKFDWLDMRDHPVVGGVPEE